LHTVEELQQEIPAAVISVSEETQLQMHLDADRACVEDAFTGLFICQEY
jgi:hypothetical protein